MLLYRVLRELPTRTTKALRSEEFNVFLCSSGLEVGILGLIFVSVLPVSPLLRNRLAWRMLCHAARHPYWAQNCGMGNGTTLFSSAKGVVDINLYCPCIHLVTHSTIFLTKGNSGLDGRSRGRREESTIGMDCEEIEVAEATNEQNPVSRTGRRIRNMKRAEPRHEGHRRRVVDWVTKVRASAYPGSDTTTTSNSSL